MSHEHSTWGVLPEPRRNFQRFWLEWSFLRLGFGFSGFGEGYSWKWRHSECVVLFFQVANWPFFSHAFLTNYLQKQCSDTLEAAAAAAFDGFDANLLSPESMKAKRKSGGGTWQQVGTNSQLMFPAPRCVFLILNSFYSILFHLVFLCTPETGSSGFVFQEGRQDLPSRLLTLWLAQHEYTPWNDAPLGLRVRFIFADVWTGFPLLPGFVQLTNQDRTNWEHLRCNLFAKDANPQLEEACLFGLVWFWCLLCQFSVLGVILTCWLYTMIVRLLICFLCAWLLAYLVTYLNTCLLTCFVCLFCCFRVCLLPSLHPRRLLNEWLTMFACFLVSVVVCLLACLLACLLG